MKTIRCSLLIAVGLVLGFGLATFTGCGEDTPSDNAEEGVEETGEKAEEGAEDVGDEVEQQLD